MTGININYVELLRAIGEDSTFKKDAGTKFQTGERLFIAGPSENMDMLILQDSSGDRYQISGGVAKEMLGLTDKEFEEKMQELSNANNFATQNEIQNSIQVGVGKLDDSAWKQTATEGMSVNKAQFDNNYNEIFAPEATTAVASANATNAVSGTQNVGATNATSSVTSVELQKEIDGLTAQREANAASMQSLQNQITELQAKIKDAVEEVIAKNEKITQEKQEDANRIVKQHVEDFRTRRNKNENVSKQDFEAGLRTALAGCDISENVSDSIITLMGAETNMQLMSNLLDQLGVKSQLDKDLGAQIDSKCQELEEVKAAEEAAAAARSCDPIGFQNSDGVQFDFFFDDNNDGLINSVYDFVGAKDTQDGWNEMANLDGANGAKEGVIESEELEAANVKVMVTNADGTQKAMTISDFEATYGNLEINAQKDAAINSTVKGPNNFETDETNQMLGTYSLSVGDEELKGYQTLDSVNWLYDNYEISDSKDSVTAQTIGAAPATETTNAIDAFIEDYKNNVMPLLQEKINSAYEALDASEELIGVVKEFSQLAGEIEAQTIANEIEKQEETVQQEKREELQAQRRAEVKAELEQERAAAGDDTPVTDEDIDARIQLKEAQGLQQE